MTYDVIVIGGSYAGISAAIQLGRARQKVLVVDGGSRRNRFASSSHGFLGQDGRDPAAIAATGKAEVLAYPTVTWVEGLVTRASGALDAFTVELGSRERHEARRLVLALGVVDELPAIPGLAERWGQSVFHCPYCHGYELDRGAIAVLATSPFSTHQGMMLPDWGETTYFTQGFEPDDDAKAGLLRRGAAIERTKVIAVEGDTPRIELRLEDGRVLPFAGAFVASKTRVASPIVAELGCALEDGPLGPFVKTDLMKETTVPGVFACGDAAIAAGSVAFAVGEGVRAGVSAHRSLMFA